jgi:hypothetical protein
MLRLLCWSWPPFVDAIGYVDPLLGCFVRCNLAGDTLLGVRAYSRAGATSGLAPLWPSIQSRMCESAGISLRLEEADLDLSRSASFSLSLWLSRLSICML